jgi:hypothetical protein
MGEENMKNRKIVEETIEDIDPTADVTEGDITDGDQIDETAASDSIKAHGAPSRLDVMTNTISAMAKMNDTELTKWFRDAIQTSSQYASTGKDTSDSNKASLNMKPSATGANPMGPLPFVPVAKEDLAVVFDAMGLTEEDLKDKTLTLFEAALNARLTLEVTRIEEQYEEKLIEEIEAIREDLTDKVDQYLDYAAQEFVTENEIAIENALKLELFEDFMGGLKQLFVEHYIEVPDDKLDVLTNMSEQVVELETKLNEAIEAGLAKDEKINEMVAQKAFAEVAEGLSITETSKLRTLVETVEFDGDVDALKAKLTIIKEANFKSAPKKAPKTGIIQEETEVVITGDVGDDGTVERRPDPRVAGYVAAISRSAKSVGR